MPEQELNGWSETTSKFCTPCKRISASFSSERSEQVAPRDGCLCFQTAPPRATYSCIVDAVRMVVRRCRFGMQTSDRTGVLCTVRGGATQRPQELECIGGTECNPPGCPKGGQCASDSSRCSEEASWGRSEGAGPRGRSEGVPLRTSGRSVLLSAPTRAGRATLHQACPP